MAQGLDDVIAADTVLSHVDGKAGRLIVRGFDLEQIAGQLDYEGVVALLWDGFADEPQGVAAVRAALAAARTRAFAIGQPLYAEAARLSPIEGLRLLLAELSDAETVPHHVLAVAAVPVFVAAIERQRAGAALLAPDAALGHTADFLRMLRGVPAPAAHVRALDTYLVAVADHGLNASTFTARVVASTKAGMFSAVVAGLCALKGPLHGGAPGPVLDMLDAIGSEANIGPWLEQALDDGDRLMGFGHRVYRVRDPRADVLKQVALDLRGGSNRIRFAEAVEAGALAELARRKQNRRLDTNVEFYTALVLEALQLPREIFTSVFGIGRVAGWTAHVLEQLASNRLIRPQSRYIGPQPRRAA